MSTPSTPTPRGLPLLFAAGLALNCTAEPTTAPMPEPAPVPEPAPEPTSVVVLTLDTTRADHLGSYGYFRDTSPNLDRLADTSLRFERCLAPMANTLPAHATLFTGLQPLEHGALTILGGSGRALSDAGLPLLAEHARAAGYRTAAFVSAAPVKRGTGLERGFEDWDEPVTIERSAAETTELALAWLAEAPAEPYLLWVHYFDPHMPLEPPEPYGTWTDDAPAREAYMAARGIPELEWTTREGPVLTTSAMLDAYDGEIRAMDHAIGRLLTSLEGRPDWERTALVAIGDHGEGLGQHEWLDHDRLWDEQLRVPLIMRAPGAAPAVIRRPLSMADVFPTLIGQLEGQDLGSFAAATAGRDVLAPEAPAPLVLGAVPADQITSADHACSVTTERWKLLVSMRGAGSEQDRLFDLLADPHERDDVAVHHPEQVQRLRAHALGPCTELWSRALDEQPGLGPETPDGAVLQQRILELQALGYLEGETAP